MRTKLIFLMVLVSTALNAQNKLAIVVDGIEKVKGHLLVGLYDEAGFLKKPVGGKYVEVKGETVTIEMDSLKTGEYAVSLFQDENDNKKLDMGTFGPTEKCGFSNNAKGKMGPPSYSDCKFRVEEDTVIYITVN